MSPLELVAVGLVLGALVAGARELYTRLPWRYAYAGECFSVSWRKPRLGPDPVGFGVRLFVFEKVVPTDPHGFVYDVRRRLVQAWTVDVLLVADLQVSYFRILSEWDTREVHSDLADVDRPTRVRGDGPW